MIIWKFNILEFKRGGEQSSQLALQWTEFVSVRKREKSVPNLPHGIYFHAHVVWKSTVLSWRTKTGKKCPKFAERDLFPRACSVEIDSFELAYENGKKVSQICRTGFISTRV